MIEAYFEEVEGVLQDFPNIRSYTLTKRIYNLQQGHIGGTITFDAGWRLEFVEVKDAEVAEKLKYRYQFINERTNRFFVMTTPRITQTSKPSLTTSTPSTRSWRATEQHYTMSCWRSPS